MYKISMLNKLDTITLKTQVALHTYISPGISSQQLEPTKFVRLKQRTLKNTREV